MSKAVAKVAKKVADLFTQIAEQMFKSISVKKTDEPVTPKLYSLLPKVAYLLTLVAIETDKETIQLTEKNEKDVFSKLNKMYTDSKKIILYFVSAVPLSQEVVVHSKKLGSNVKIKNLGAVLKYDWKARQWHSTYFGYHELDAKERELTEWRFDQGLVKFAEENKIRFIKSSVQPE